MNLKVKEMTAVGEIRDIQQMWDQTIKYKNAGDYDTDAMWKIYNAMSPKLTFQDIANVFSGVYADTYWENIRMDSAVLSKSMVQTLALSRERADAYASNAMKQWRGILCRKNIQDTGIIPVSGSYTGSLDIICNENTPLNPQQLIKNWNSSYWKQPVVGKNYIYTRCQNIYFRGDLADGLKVQMYYTTGGFNQPPSSWIQCLTAGGQKPEGKIELLPVEKEMWPGDRGASEGFFFEPKTSDHVCVIAVIASKYFSRNDPQKVPSGNWNSNTWITHNGASAWHNENPQINIEDTLTFCNQDGTGEDFVISAKCRNVPVGSKICLSSKDKDCQFTTGMVSIANPSQVIEKYITIPGNYSGALTVHAEDPDGKLLPVSAALELSMEWILPHNHIRYMDVAEVYNKAYAVRNNLDIKLNMGEFTIIGRN